MNWSNDWIQLKEVVNPVPSNPWDAMSQDQILMLHQDKQRQLAALKEEEMKLRKYIVDRAFPQKNEGMNTLDLGGGFQLKAGVKFNYKLADNQTVENGLDAIAKVGNEGAFIADRLVGWTPDFKLTEYRKLQADSDNGNATAKEILKIVNTFLTIEDAAPTLAIKEPKGK